MTQTRREYAASLGLAIAGARGKFSNDAKAAIAKAEAEGTVFSDSPSVKAEIAAAKETVTVSYRSPAAGDSPYILASDYRFPEGEYKAVGQNKTVYGMREACSNCGVSLVMCSCLEPVVYGNIRVDIVPAGR